MLEIEKPIRKQEIYKIWNSKDFLKTDMTDINLIVAILAWNECGKKYEKFYKAYKSYEGDVFQQSDKIIYSTFRDFMRLSDDDRIFKVAKWIDDLFGFSFQYIDFYLGHFIRFAIRTLGKRTITPKELEDIFIPMKYSVLDRGNLTYIVKDKETKLIFDKDKDKNIIIFKDPQ